MNKYISLSSFAKINIHLGILGKKKSDYHEIETYVSFISLCDKIFIKKINQQNHVVKFLGNFSKNIKKKNSITNLLEILDKDYLLKGKFKIMVHKSIPTEAGLGGGSTNAAVILNFLIKKKLIKINKLKIKHICDEIGSDVVLGLNFKNKILMKGKKLFDIKSKNKFHLVLIKPNFGCKTSEIYKNNKIYSKPVLKKKKFNLNQMIDFSNDLEKSAFSIYPKLNFLKNDLSNLPNILFARMTGSGSTIIGYFLRKKDAYNGTKLLKKKYKKYWCVQSKTI